MASITEALDRLGMTLDIDDGDLVMSAVIVASVLVPNESVPRLCIVNSDGLSWIEQAGMLRIAERMSSESPEEDDQ